MSNDDEDVRRRAAAIDAEKEREVAKEEARKAEGTKRLDALHKIVRRTLERLPELKGRYTIHFAGGALHVAFKDANASETLVPSYFTLRFENGEIRDMNSMSDAGMPISETDAAERFKQFVARWMSERLPTVASRDAHEKARGDAATRSLVIGCVVVAALVIAIFVFRV